MAQQPQPGATAESVRGMVVTVSRPATEVGVDVLKRGGNAVDAAVAVAFALEVTWPEAGNIGGGGFMLVHPGPGKVPVVVDYRETAPAAARPDMFRTGKFPDAQLVGVPGTVRGLELAHRRFGKLPWKDLVVGAVRLADDGIVVNEALAKSLNEALKTPGGNDEFRRVYGKPDAAPWQAGDRLVQKDLAATLRKIADGGPDAFYLGPLADLFDAEMKREGGIATKDDLKNYRAKERTPIACDYRGHRVYGPPPPSSAGICLAEMLNVAARFDLKKDGRWSPRTIHLMAEAMRRGFHDRARHLGDPDFVKVPPHLTTLDYAKTLADSIDPAKATKSDDLGKDILRAEEGSQTTHFSIVDANGMAVANTYTLEQSFGCRIVVKGAGYLLNDEMRDFNPRPGVTDASGTIGTPPNLIAPNKRMLSSMCPTIVTKDGNVVLVTGSPGGRTIINTVFGVLVNVLEYDMPLRDAVDAPRIHHGWMPDRLRLEPELIANEKLLDRLKAMGHAIEPAPSRQGDAHSIRIDPKTGRALGIADRRLAGWAAGVD